MGEPWLEALPIRWIGCPAYPSDPPGDFERGPCAWYRYEDPDEILQRHLERPAAGDDGSG